MNDFLFISRAVVVAVGLGCCATANAQSSDQELAKQLTNPIASLISFPIQQNFDFGYGSDGDGWKSTTNVQPVVPVPIGENWNLISRTILPIVYQDGVSAPGDGQFGLGDVTQSVFFSPKKTGASGIIWGAGPAFLVPTATNRALGNDKWGVGPTVVIVKQAGHSTFGMLANHIWSFAGSDNRSDVSATFIQPFFAHTTAKATTYTLNSEMSYDWKSEHWLIPINVQISQLMKFGNQPVSLGAGVKYYVESPDGGPDWGLRLSLTFLFPKH